MYLLHPISLDATDEVFILNIDWLNITCVILKIAHYK